MGLPVVLRLSDYFMLCPRFDFIYNKKPCEDCLTKGYKCCIERKCVKNSRSASMIRVISMKIHEAMHIYDKVDAFITPSQFLKNKLVNSGYNAEKIHCIPTFTTISNSNAKTTIGNYALYFGRITEEKGVSIVVSAYEKMPNRNVIIMGDDSTDEGIRLKEYVRAHNLKNIKFIGFKTGDEQADYIRNARFTIIPSIWYDNLPNTALESFAYSKPVIATNIGSLPELVKDGYNGYLFDPGDVNDLINTIKRLDDDRVVDEFGSNSYELLTTEFSASKHYEELMKVFNNLTVVK